MSDKLHTLDHETRAGIFIKDGQKLIKDKYPELTVELYDETNAMLDASAYFGKEAEMDEDIEAREFFKSESQRFDQAGATSTSVRNMLYGTFPTHPNTYPKRMEDALSALNNLANNLGGIKVGNTTKPHDDRDNKTTDWTYNSKFIFA